MPSNMFSDTTSEYTYSSTANWISWEDISRAASVITSSVPYTLPYTISASDYDFISWDEAGTIRNADFTLHAVAEKPKVTKKRDPKISQQAYDEFMNSDYE